MTRPLPTLAFTLFTIALMAIVGTVAEAQQKRIDQINQEAQATWIR